jgi:hypothetical protein
MLYKHAAAVLVPRNVGTALASYTCNTASGGGIMFKALFMMIVVSNDYAARLVQRFSRRTA